MNGYYDAYGLPTFLTSTFDNGQAVSRHDWEFLSQTSRYDSVTGLYHTAYGFYHAQLGRAVATGAISVIAEAHLNSRAQGFPFGNPLPSGPTSWERWVQEMGEYGPWIKAGVGLAALTATTIGLGVHAFASGPVALVNVAGAIAGALHGGIEAFLHGGNFGDVLLGVGLGAAFGAMAPLAGVGALIGGTYLGGISALLGHSGSQVATAYTIGGLIGGVYGGYADALRVGLRPGTALVAAMAEVEGAAVGSLVGYSLDGTNGALLGATLGMFAGGIAFGIGRWAVHRGRHSRASGASGRTLPADDPVLDNSIFSAIVHGDNEAIVFAQRNRGLMTVIDSTVDEALLRYNVDDVLFTMTRYGITSVGDPDPVDIAAMIARIQHARPGRVPTIIDTASIVVAESNGVLFVSGDRRVVLDAVAIGVGTRARYFDPPATSAQRIAFYSRVREALRQRGVNPHTVTGGRT